MTASMTRQKRDGYAFKLAYDERIRRIAERCLDFLLSYILKLGHLIKARAADDSDLYFFH